MLFRSSAVMGLIAVLFTGRSNLERTICVVAAFVISLAVWLYVFWKNPHLKHPDGAPNNQPADTVEGESGAELQNLVEVQPEPEEDIAPEAGSASAEAKKK